MRVAEDRPLIVAAEERTREIAYRCASVERACRAIGFAGACGYERVATLVARVAGEATLRRTVAEIAEDKAVGLSRRHVSRAIEELVAMGVLVAEVESAAPTIRRGRPAKCWLLRVDWAEVRRVVSESIKWESEHRGDVVQTESMGRVESAEKSTKEKTENVVTDLWTSDGHGADTQRADDGHGADTQWAKCGHLADHTALYPLTQNPGPLSPPAEMESEGEDQRCEWVDRDSTVPTLRRLASALRDPQGDVRTLWQVAAAFDAGLISEHAIADAARAAVLLSGRSRVGYFRTVLAERCETTREGLTQLLSQVRMRGGWPTGLPPKERSAVTEGAPPAARLRRVPAAERSWDANEARNQIWQALETIG